jgi:hypothetical protein
MTQLSLMSLHLALMQLMSQTISPDLMQSQQLHVHGRAGSCLCSRKGHGLSTLRETTLHTSLTIGTAGQSCTFSAQSIRKGSTVVDVVLHTGSKKELDLANNTETDL